MAGPDQQPISSATRVEVRLDGRVRFSNDCYDVSLSQENDVFKLTGALHPTLVDVEPVPPERFGDDPRDGEEVIQQVHSGSRRKVRKPPPKEEP